MVTEEVVQPPASPMTCNLMLVAYERVIKEVVQPPTSLVTGILRETGTHNHFFTGLSFGKPNEK